MLNISANELYGLYIDGGHLDNSDLRRRRNKPQKTDPMRI